MLDFLDNMFTYFDNEYFLVGILFGFVCKYFLVFGSEYFVNDRFDFAKLLGEFGMGIVSVVLVSFIFLSKFDCWSSVCALKALLCATIFVIFISKIMGSFEISSKKIFTQVNINNFFLPIFILISYLFSNDIIALIVVGGFLLLVSFYIREDDVVLENLLYPIYIVVFVIAVVMLNVSFLSDMKESLSLFLNLNLVLLLIGVMFGYIYFLTCIFIMFLFTYLPGKRERGYTERMNKRMNFIRIQFKNNHNMIATVVYLVFLFSLFFMNYVYDYFTMSFFLFLFLLTNPIVTLITSRRNEV